MHIYTDSAERQARLRGARSVAGAAALRASPLGEDGDEGGAAVTVVEFFDAPALERFMLHGDKQQDGACDVAGACFHACGATRLTLPSHVQLYCSVSWRRAARRRA